MKIKLWLVIVGAGFSYSLITLRSTLDASGYIGDQVEDQVVIEISSDSQENTPNASHFMIIMPREADSLLENENLGLVIPQVDSHSQQDNSDSGLLIARSMGCIEALKKENANIINAISKHVEEFLKATVVDRDQIIVHRESNLVVDALPSGIINELNETVRLMMTAGSKKEFCRMYSSWRREFLEECLSTLGLQVEELNMEHVDNIMEMIEIWIKAWSIAVILLFPNERRLCDLVFEDSVSSANIAFIEVCTKLAVNLLSFNIALTTCTWHQLPIPLSDITPKVFTTLQGLMQEFELLLYL